MPLVLFSLGAVSLLGQVVLLRELGIAFYGSELVYIFGLGAWLLGSAMGALVPDVGTVAPAPVRVRRGLGLVAVLLPVAAVLSHSLRPALGSVRGADVEVGRQLVGVLVVLGPVSAVLGILFRVAAQAQVQKGGTLARAYAVESLGAAAGGLLATTLPGLGIPGLVGVLAASALAAATAVTMAARAAERRESLILAGVLVLVLGCLVVSNPAHRILTRWAHPDLIATRDTPFGRLTLTGREDQVAVYRDDALAYENQGTGGEEFAHLAALQRPQLARALVLGGWVENLAGELAAYPIGEIVQVEQDRALVDLATATLPGRDRAEALVFEDPRRFLARTGPNFDLILSGLPDPASGRANRHFTAEFFAICADALTPQGVLALRLRTAENLWTPRQIRRVAAVHAALKTVFAEVLVLPGTTSVLLASQRPLVRDPEILAARLAEVDPPARLVSAGWLRWLVLNDRTKDIDRVLGEADVPANRDLRPTCYADTLILDLARFFPGLGWRQLPRTGRWLWLVVLVLVVAAAPTRRSRRLQRAWAAGYAGLAAMVLETVLILHDQTVRGVLYRDLGLLLTVFMLGLAAGAWRGERFARSGRARWRRPLLVIALSGWGFATGMALLAGLAALGTSLLMLAVTGALTALLFAAAASDAEDSVGPVYAADLAGGALGCLGASLLLVPFAGLPATCLAVAVLAFPVAVVVWPGLPGISWPPRRPS